MAEQAKMVQKIAADYGGANFSWTTKPEDRQKLWRARHDVVYADRALRSGGQIFATDVCVPISRLAECIVATEKTSQPPSYQRRLSAMSATATSTW